MFSVSVGLWSGFPVAPLLTRTSTSFGYWIFRCLLTSNTESCDQDDEEVGVGVVEELVDKPGTTNGT